MSKSKSELLAKIDQKKIEATAKLDQEAEFLNLLPDDLEFESIHAYKLYDTIGSITFSVETRKGILPLIEQFKPLPTVMYRDSCLSFRHEGGLTEKEKERAQSIIPVFPVTFHCDQGIDYPGTNKFNWFADLGGKVVRIEVKVTKDWNLAQWHYDRVARYGQYVIEHEMFRTDLEHGINTKWGNGGPEYLHPHTIHWDREREFRFDILKEEA